MPNPDHPTTNHEAVTEFQMNKLRSAICNSPDASEESKKAILWLIEECRMLTRNVTASFTSENGSLDIVSGLHDMTSHGRSTRLDNILGSIFSTHQGSYSTNGAFDTKRDGHTIWLSRKAFYDHDAEKIETDMEVIAAVSLDV
ncbi:hypothetical protein HOD24_01690 [Candidatus Peregrinibacteria bacterium]|jgi:hypothetical protein|nr:hypothetical protein [Candidatus Peregrinibacteria bacterium]